MIIELLDSEEKFKQLKIGDRLLVKWSDYYVKHNKNIETVMLYKIQKILDNNEIICQDKNNHYFNYSMYLEKNSVALVVYKVSII